jgi:hypothetical protein
MNVHPSNAVIGTLRAILSGDAPPMLNSGVNCSLFGVKAAHMSDLAHFGDANL